MPPADLPSQGFTLMTSILLRIADLIDKVTLFAGRLAVLLVIALVFLVFYNVIGRYIIGGSPIWLQELEWHLMAPAMLIGVTVLLKEGGHVRVDMLYSKLPERAQFLFDGISMVLGIAIALLFVKYSQGFLESSWSVFEGSPDPGGLPGRYLLKSILPICFILMALQCFANAIRHFVDFFYDKTTSKQEA